MSASSVVAIPARLGSTRLERKVLTDIGGRSLLARTHDVAISAQAGPVVVLTDSEEVADVVRDFGGEVLLTAVELDSGTARVASVIDALDADVVVNLQGDAPLTDPAIVARSAEQAAATGAAVTMAVYALEHAADLHDPSVVKVVRAHDGRVLYCSRSAIPHVRDAPTDLWTQRAACLGHSGIYAYGRAFLESFAELPPSPLEDAERLEQLRWLQAGLHVHSFLVEPQGPSVDTPQQLERVRAAFAEREGLPA
ncbi:MAG: 3-deoxy-manno-octulosonate cytidylyltransferase [Solirubrobacteraceae bacterium]|nr:3-deoxy-manno-octulosonate cytidylyltransferase [Solirubrobacteraceae bacterium]